MFLKTNFESLTSADEIFQLYESGHHYLLSPGRPSISTMYLSKSKYVSHIVLIIVFTIFHINNL